MAFRMVARLSDLPDGRGCCVTLDGIEVGLFRVDGEVHAMENRCPHAGDPLSEGRLDGSIVICRAHGWRFDLRTGFRPEHADGFPIPCFAVCVDGEDIYVDIEKPLNLRRGA